MSNQYSGQEPTRPTDVTRLNLARLRVEDGMSVDSIFRLFTEAAADGLQVERVGIWLMTENRESLRCVDLYERSTASHSSGITLKVAEFPDYFQALENRRTLPAEVAPSDPRTSKLAEAYLNPLGITSLLDAPIFIGGEVVGALCHEHIGPPREWTTEQRDFAGSMADLLSLKIRAAETEELKAALRTQATQLSESWRTGALAQTAAGVAHDFKNVLHVVLGLAGEIAKDPSCPPKLAECAEQIFEAAKRGADLASALLDFANPRTGASRVIHPAQTIADMHIMLKAAVGTKYPVNLDIRSASGQVMIDPSLLERVILNLVTNARDAMPDGGAVTIGVESVSEVDDHGKSGQFVLVSVSDEGTGISPDALPRIFEPFFTTKPKGQGTGVGLAVVHQIVAHAGGYMRVESTPGKGTCFRIYLPRVSSL